MAILSLAGLILSLADFRPRGGKVLKVPLAHDDDDPDQLGPFPWSSKVWLGAVNTASSIWRKTAHVNDKNSAGWNNPALEIATSYGVAFWDAPTSDRQALMKGFDDNKDEGRQLWAKYVKHASSKIWKLPQLVDRILDSNDAGLQSLMEAYGELPDTSECDFSRADMAMAMELFGQDAFVPNTNRLHKPIKAFLEGLWLLTRDRYKRQVSRHQNTGTQRVQELDAAFAELNLAPSKAKIVAFVKTATTLLNELKAINWVTDAEKVQSMLDKLKNIRAVLKAGRDGKAKTRLGPALTAEIVRMADSPTISRVLAELNSAIDGTTVEEDTGRLAESLLEKIDFGEGVEDFKKSSYADMCDLLGIPRDGTIRGLNTLMAANGLSADPWSDGGKNPFFDVPGNTAPLKPEWHQLVGIAALLQRIFTDYSVLLMDEVGLGKTLQSYGVMALLVDYRRYFAKHGRFPGMFEKCRFPGTVDGNVPDLPFVITAAPTLINQWCTEGHKFLTFGAWRLFPYEGTMSEDARSNFWKMVETLDKDADGKPLDVDLRPQVIILASHTALARDLRLVELAAPTYGPSEKLVIRSEDAKSRAPTTIFGREYACGFIDEVHMLRKPKAKAYQASRFLSQLCKARMALTATPVVTAPQDLWNVGRILQVKGFGPEGDADLMNMERDLRNAKAITRKEKREAAAAAEANDGRAEEVLRRGIFSEEHTLNLGDVPALLIEQARDIRRRLEKCCIRRTLTSTDFEDKPILKLPKWEERFLRITLDASELAFLDDIYSHLPTSTSSTGSKPGEHFYLSIRLALTNRRSVDPDLPTAWPSTLAEWEETPGRKLDAVAQVITHHLATDNAPLLHVVGTGYKLHPDANEPPERPTELKSRDKIVIYSAFTTHLAIIHNRLALDGIEVQELNGGMTPAVRNKVLADFMTREDGPRVLLVSSVALAGLNIFRANILIILDTLWSAQEDQQLIGRLWRNGQQKQVIVYRIIAENTTDVLLNNIAFDKIVILHAFTGASSALIDMLTRDDPLNDEVDNEVDHDTKPPPKSKGKRKVKAKAMPEADQAEEASEEGAEPQAKGKAKAPRKPRAQAPPKEKAPAKPRAPRKPRGARASTAVIVDHTPGPSTGIEAHLPPTPPHESAPAPPPPAPEFAPAPPLPVSKFTPLPPPPAAVFAPAPPSPSFGFERAPPSPVPTSALATPPPAPQFIPLLPRPPPGSVSAPSPLAPKFALAPLPSALEFTPTPPPALFVHTDVIMNERALYSPIQKTQLSSHSARDTDTDLELDLDASTRPSTSPHTSLPPSSRPSTSPSPSPSTRSRASSPEEPPSPPARDSGSRSSQAPGRARGRTCSPATEATKRKVSDPTSPPKAKKGRAQHLHVDSPERPGDPVPHPSAPSGSRWASRTDITGPLAKP